MVCDYWRPSDKEETEMTRKDKPTKYPDLLRRERQRAIIRGRQASAERERLAEIGQRGLFEKGAAANEK